MKPEDLGPPELLQMEWGTRRNYNRAIFIDEVMHDRWPPTFMVNVVGNPKETSGNLGHSSTLDGAQQIACFYLDSLELQELKRKNPYEQVRPHLSHPDCFEVAVYEEEGSITVECVKCGVVLHELYNKEDDDGFNTSAPEQQ